MWIESLTKAQILSLFKVHASHGSQRETIFASLAVLEVTAVRCVSLICAVFVCESLKKLGEYILKRHSVYLFQCDYQCNNILLVFMAPPEY